MRDEEKQMKPKMTIEQTDNGWILSYYESARNKTTVCTTWEAVLQVLDEYFGWHNMYGQLKKKL